MVAEGRREGGSKESRGETNMSHTHTHTGYLVCGTAWSLAILSVYLCACWRCKDIRSYRFISYGQWRRLSVCKNTNRCSDLSHWQHRNTFLDWSLQVGVSYVCHEHVFSDLMCFSSRVSPSCSASDAALSVWFCASCADRMCLGFSLELLEHQGVAPRAQPSVFRKQSPSCSFQTWLPECTEWLRCRCRSCW